MLLGKVNSTIQTSFNQFWESNLCYPVTSLVKEKENEFTNSNRFDRLHQYACNPNNFWPQVREQIKKLPAAFHEIEKSGKLIWADSIYFISDVPGKNDGT